ncbi:MAG: YabP/YqfC family sporulation protein [Muricomes sp.]
MNREKENDRLRKSLHRSSMPKDVVLGAAVVTIIGAGEVCIENYRGIIEYTDVLIRVQTKGYQIKLQGKHLQIEYYTNDEMKITGQIVSLEYEVR